MRASTRFSKRHEELLRSASATKLSWRRGWLCRNAMKPEEWNERVCKSATLTKYWIWNSSHVLRSFVDHESVMQ